ncbi:ribonucleotide-diphosphate reductase subunit beta [Fluviispira sanaruensis]|uniref:Ribonucleoside-diphosphate reductase subunit beta n=1 Tax=Fluviispira sanaruensis TaxID=2493639 RepID=A0A4P2VMP9_FLUSA|nr:ribonucleotide-diphosphate reductase subunit beta [Fluviispira sanaruensis]BBH53170.1 ribonucleotide-diphosphate reductase subunit beta [Fluviispira sanaruensis]
MLINETKTQLMPFQYPWAWDEFKNLCKNHWLPQEVSMAQDIAQWKNQGYLTNDERHLIKKILAFFANTDVLVGDNIIMAIYKHITNPECRQYLTAQAFQESIHSWSYSHIVESLSMDQQEVFSEFKKVGTIKDKHDFQAQFLEGILNADFSTLTAEGRSLFLKNLCAYYIGMEGMQFYSAFVLLLNFKRRNLLVGTSEQLEYIVRDESLHCRFGTKLINQYISENADIWTKELQEEVRKNIEHVVELEDAFVSDALPRDVLGLSYTQFAKYIRYIADRRVESIGLEPIYGEEETPFPWMNEIMDLPKEKNFFETRVTEYQTGFGLEW